MKKVLCLYRVSTKMQVNKETDDIPMQKAECEKFIAKHSDWQLHDEIAEKGISGFKNTSHNRDALNEIMERATRKEFDILLVYMSDRLGRREDDTPFYVADLNNLGVEVWSVNENQLKTEEHIDKLMNYIRFWNAEGESLKTSVRVRDAQLEMVKRGEYTGGGCPYGYNQVYSGKYNNKGRALKKIEINLEQAEIVKKIFELSTNQGMGAWRIASILNEENIPTQKNSKWTVCTISNILRNPIYKGYYTYGKSRFKGQRGHTSPDSWVYSEIQHPELVIIEESYWNKAQRVREARTPDYYKKENMSYGNFPKRSDGKLLLMGLACCDYCNSKLSNGSAYDYWENKDGSKHKKIRGRYKCISKSEGKPCTGHYYYNQEELEGAVLQAVSNYITQLKDMNIHNQILQEQQARQKQEQKALHSIQRKIKSLQADLDTLKSQIPQVIRGEFMLSMEELKELIEDTKSKLSTAQIDFCTKQQEFEACNIKQKDILQLSHIIPKWEGFRDLPLNRQRMFLSTIINRIYVKEGSLRIEMRINPGDFLPPTSTSNGDPLDWCSNNVSCITDKVVNKVKENDIILMHDYYDTSVTAALKIVDELLEEGFEFVTVEEILFD